MKSLLVFVTFVAWSLWFGGSISIFVFGSYFQRNLPPETFHATARALFHIFSKYELGLAAISLLSSGLWMVFYPSKAPVILLGCLVLAGGMTVTFALGLIPAMDALLDEGRRDSIQFKTLHGKSMVALLLQSLVLLVTGWILFQSQGPWASAITPAEETETFAETARV
jgi:hypothetical protein